MSFRASPISCRAEPNPPFLARIALSSSSLGGISGVRSTEISTEPIEQTAPSMNEPTTQYGIPAPVAPEMSSWNTKSDRLASVMPRPVKNDWARNPLPSWDGGSLSAMNARYGSIAVLLLASSSQSRMTAITHRGDEREEEQTQAAADRAHQEERFASAPARTPRPVGQGADQRLDEQSGDRTGQVQDRRISWLGAQELIHRIHSSLLHAEAVLDAEEPEVHDQDRRHRHQRLGPHDAGVLQVGRGSHRVAS